MRTARSTLRDVVMRVGPARRAWTVSRRSKLERAYVERRERYRRAATDQGLSYSEGATTSLVRERLAARGWAPTVRAPGEVRTFAFVPMVGWHAALLPDLRELGPLTVFDYVAHGSAPHDLMPGRADAAARRAAMNAVALDAVRSAHAADPIDWIFVYASGLEIERATLDAITSELGVPLVNMCLDDKQSWEGPRVGEQRLGQIDIAAGFDVSWTSARVACEWYLVEGARPLYMPEGYCEQTHHPEAVRQDIDVSFVGERYGFRADVVDELRRHGIEIATFGPGWDRGPVWGDDQVDIFRRSRINLGMGGIGYHEDLVNVKTRDFEIPGTGGGMYLTTYSPDLAEHFCVGDEIACYGSRAEIVEQVRAFLATPERARSMAERARERCVREHRWLHRYLRVLEVLGIVRWQR